MCLSKCTKLYKGRNKPSGVGYKVVNKYPSGYTFMYYKLERRKRIPFDTWLTSSKGTIRAGYYGYKEYPQGFHIYLNRHSAIANIAGHGWRCAIKVRYKQAVARGLQSDSKVIVARKMYVEKQ